MIRKSIIYFLKKLNLRIVRGYSDDNRFYNKQLLQALSHKREGSLHNVKRNRKENQFIDFVLNNYHESYAQNFQDLFCLWTLQSKKNGIFIEFGGVDGIHLSNTLLLEQRFGWQGVIAEPAKEYHDKLMKNREAEIEKDCIWIESGKKLEFTYIPNTGISNTLNYSNDKNSIKYQVNTISLNDLVLKYKLKHIDFLSIDTEGTEFSILKSFDFLKTPINIICVEHNYNKKIRNNIKALLEKHDFIRVFDHLSFQDDWYIYKNIS
jgi:FkbM family methyltransferase